MTTYFFGSTLDYIDYEDKRIRNIKSPLARIEPELYSKKWWDYRLEHPTKSTYRFAEAYRQAVKFSIKRRLDRQEGNMNYGMKKADFLQVSKTFATGMWKARQAADSYGIPYAFWCVSAMLYCEKNLWAFIPRPNQLYGSVVRSEHASFKVSMIDFILLRWADRNEGGVLCASHEFYRAEYYTGHIYQEAHLELIIQQIRESKNQAMVVAELLFMRKVITADWIRTKLGDIGASVLEQALSLKSIVDE